MFICGVYVVDGGWGWVVRMVVGYVGVVYVCQCFMCGNVLYVYVRVCACVCVCVCGLSAGVCLSCQPLVSEAGLVGWDGNVASRPLVSEVAEGVVVGRW